MAITCSYEVVGRKDGLVLSHFTETRDWMKVRMKIRTNAPMMNVSMLC